MTSTTNTMRTEQHANGWWIVDVPAYQVDGDTFTTCGPYDTKAAAESDRRGMERFWKFEANKPPRKTTSTVAVVTASPTTPTDDTGPQRTLF